MKLGLGDSDTVVGVSYLCLNEKRHLQLFKNN